MSTYQQKLVQMAALAPELELTMALPPRWRDRAGVTELEEGADSGDRGFRVEVLPLAFNGHYHLHFYPTLGRLVREVQPDIVHIDEEPYNLATYHANMLARRAGARTLWFSWQNLRRDYPPPFAWWEQYNLKHVAHAIVGSQTAAQVWRAKGYEGALSVIPQFGVDPVTFSPPATPRPDSPVHIAYAGRWVAEKGIDLLLHALAGVGGEWRATILGSGPESARLQRLADTLRLSERVTFRPTIPTTEMADFYRSVDILVLPSRSSANWTEQFGRVLIEAMACEVAVVGAATGEIPHVIGEAGITFPEEDQKALREALQRLVAEPEVRRRLAREGRARILSQYTQRHVAEATLDVYREILL